MQFTRNKSPKFLGIFILAFLGSILFFYRLSDIPSGFYIDEALHGYNAFSILETGRDEYGKFMPLVFRFYGSFNAPLYVYLTAPFIEIFGVNVFAVRFPSALLGLLTAFLVYFLLKKSRITNDKHIPWAGAVFAVISPWLILHSRVGYEVSSALFIFSLGALLAWLSLTKKRFLIWSFLFLSLSTYAAYSQRFIVPLFILAFLALFRKKFFKKDEFSRRNIALALGIAFVTQIPNFYLLTTPAFFPKTELFSLGIIIDQARKTAIFLPYSLSLILSFAREVFSQYSTYFSPRSLFFLPDPDRQRSIPELSVFYFWMVVPYLSGIYLLWKKRGHDFAKFLLILLLVTPIPSSLTKNPFSTHRALPLFLPMILIITLGYGRIVKNLPSFFKAISFVSLISLSLLLLWRCYFVLLPHERAVDWGHGMRGLSQGIEQNSDMNFVIDQTRTKPVYMQIAFFLEYPPEEFQKVASGRIKDSYYEEVEFNPEYSFANIEARSIIWEKDIYEKKILVGDALSISSEQAEEHFLEKTFEIEDPLGEIVFVGYETNPEEKCESIDFENRFCEDF